VTGGSLDSEAEASHAGTILGSFMEGVDGERNNSNNYATNNNNGNDNDSEYEKGSSQNN
jgi:hypothetical protein